MPNTPRINTRKSLNNSGYTLIEMLIASVLLIVILNICLNLFISFNRIRHKGEDIMDTVSESSALEREFRSTLRTAITLPASFREYQASDELLIIQHANGKEMTLLGKVFESDTFSILRWEQMDNGWEISHLISYDLKISDVNFQRIEGVLLKLTIQLDKEFYSNSIPEMATLYMALPSGVSS